MLEIKNIIKKIENNLLLDNVSLKIMSGDKISLSGRSGSGKSLLLRAISTLDYIDSGEIIWKNKNINQEYIPFYRSQVTYIHQRPSLIDGTVADNLKKVFEFKIHQNKSFDQEKVIKYLESVNKNQDFLSKRNTNLSGGEAQIVSIIRMLQLDPEIMLLDEPTSALDHESVLAIEKLINDWFTDQKSYIWISHDREQQKRVSNKKWFMESGKLFFIA
ncbi:MAG: ATP-binding cassette domain-containing protein [Candidatus Sericytochromatia bacterium]|nr:ATP-binding cassette domain-containing protein [Candidatus Sericytochromatia bacterium]